MSLQSKIGLISYNYNNKYHEYSYSEWIYIVYSFLYSFSSLMLIIYSITIEESIYIQINILIFLIISMINFIYLGIISRRQYFKRNIKLYLIFSFLVISLYTYLVYMILTIDIKDIYIKSYTWISIINLLIIFMSNTLVYNSHNKQEVKFNINDVENQI
jgi:hypothetical protein